jgi:hypothetical protein
MLVVEEVFLGMEHQDQDHQEVVEQEEQVVDLQLQVVYQEQLTQEEVVEAEYLQV